MLPGTRLRHSKSLMWTELSPGEVLLMDPERAKYYGLRDTAAAIWAQFAEPASIDTAVSALRQLYDVDEAACRADVTACVEDMLAQSMLRVLD
jgi:hypothetical protein